jgi:hypothetical protein
MKKKESKSSSQRNQFKAYCHFCGSTVGQISDRTENLVNAIYDCEKCEVNYCDQCSYEEKIDDNLVQFCIRCENRIEKVI